MNLPAYDALVIGSGAGGAAAAYRLASAGLKVALLEKGDHLPADGRTLDIQRVVHAGEFLSRERWSDGRGRQLTPEEHFNVGGKTKWYGAALLRFDEHEFLADPEHRCAGWPIRLRDLEPYYAEAEQLLGVRTFAMEPDLARILGRLKLFGTGWRWQPIPLALAGNIGTNTREASHFDGFASVANLKGEAEASLLSRLKTLSQFSLFVNSEVRELIGRPGDPTTIQGVRLTDGREFRASRVLLAAGALHSPRVLSRYVADNRLESLLPAAAHIGAQLKLHLLTAMVSFAPRTMSDLIRKTVVITHAAFPHSSVQPLGFDAELIATLVPRLVPGFMRRELGRRAYGFFLQTEDGSHPRNRVIEAQGDANPVLDYDESRLPEAALEHRRFTRAFMKTLLRAGLVSFTRRVGLNGTAHACGSLMCGTNSRDSVVDARGRVHGMTGLHVVDGSVLPRSSRVNPSLTIYAWGLRVGDLLAQELRGDAPTSLTRSLESVHG
ncbi:MAG TPA: FAD-dependent oxidoreductase [Steroidobacteraceae bacterium]|nr:FAD-dependent oxidoreductase [Steroidobacteraceae bacterium]